MIVRYLEKVIHAQRPFRSIENKKAGHRNDAQLFPPAETLLGLAYLKHLGPAYRANALSGRLPIFHCNGFGIFHLSFRSALNTISLH
jgi:hypothetical protein